MSVLCTSTCDYSIAAGAVQTFADVLHPFCICLCYNAKSSARRARGCSSVSACGLRWTNLYANVYPITMRLTFLGTGTSMGIPVIGCRCAVCTSADPRNKRLRTSALLEVAGMNLLFDAGPDLRQQALAVGLRRLDAVLLTHAHADHVSGLDDIRPLNFTQKVAMPLYGAASTLGFVRERFKYAFVNGSEGSTRPALEPIEIY